MRRVCVWGCVTGLLVFAGGRALADGGMFLPRTIADSAAANLAQTRQEVVLAVHPYEPAGTPVSPPDECAAALPICVGLNQGAEIVLAETALSSATNDGMASCGGTSASSDVWFSYTPLRDGDASIVLWVSPTSGDTWQTDDITISVHGGCPGNDSNLLACSAPSAHETNWAPTVSFHAVAGATYYLRIAMVADTPARVEGLAIGPGAPETTTYCSAATGPVEFSQTAVTYVLRTYYRGDPSAFAWVVPVPTAPTSVVAHEDARLFTKLADLTNPRFSIVEAPKTSGGCGCAASGVGVDVGQGGQVEVEASGTAGIFDWAVLSSSGSDALLQWLDAHDFEVPDEAAGILDAYIRQDLHFLAVRVNAPEQLATDAAGAISIPPIQFTCPGSRWFYPMVISRLSAADPTEVLVYLLGNHRMEAANLPNGEIDRSALVYDPESESLTNYEALFTDALAQLGGAALITEYASQDYGLVSGGLRSEWPDAPAGTEYLNYLTRLRTVLPRSQMDQDFEFQAAATDASVYSNFTITVDETAAAGLLGQFAVVAAGYGIFCRFVKRRAQQRRRRVSAQ
jgi:hypothetical protein